MNKAARSFVELLLAGTTHPLWISSLPNEKGNGGERHVRTRDVEAILEFCKKWDVADRGTFYCVSTIDGYRRCIENAAETKILWVDIDFKDVALTQAAILKILRGLPIPPKLINASGHGLHPIWDLNDPIKGDCAPMLRRLCDLLGGDPHVCHPAALLRMPGTHNTKNGGKTLVRTLAGSGKACTQFELEAWLAGQTLGGPLIAHKSDLRADDPFLRQAKAAGFAPPIDVEARLKAMRWKGIGDAAVHPTQLAVTASLLERGLEVNEVVSQVIEATRARVDQPWNWDQEDRKVTGMCLSWLKKKHSPEDKRRKNIKAVTKTSAQVDRRDEPEPLETGQVVSLAIARAERDLKKIKPKDAHLILGRGLLNAIAERGERIMYEGGQMHRYHASAWDTYNADQEREWLGAEVQTGCETLELVPRNGLIAEARGWIQRRADLHHESVEWNEHGYIATKEGMIET
jgi:hypothetical protein